MRPNLASPDSNLFNAALSIFAAAPYILSRRSRIHVFGFTVMERIKNSPAPVLSIRTSVSVASCGMAGTSKVQMRKGPLGIRIGPRSLGVNSIHREASRLPPIVIVIWPTGIAAAEPLDFHNRFVSPGRKRTLNVADISGLSGPTANAPLLTQGRQSRCESPKPASSPAAGRAAGSTQVHLTSY